MIISGIARTRNVCLSPMDAELSMSNRMSTLPNWASGAEPSGLVATVLVVVVLMVLPPVLVTVWVTVAVTVALPLLVLEVPAAVLPLQPGRTARLAAQPTTAR